MAKTVTIDSKGRITIPKELRVRYRLQEGELATVVDKRDEILIKNGRPRLRGLLRGKIDSAGFEKDLRKLGKEWAL